MPSCVYNVLIISEWTPEGASGCKQLELEALLQDHRLRVQYHSTIGQDNGQFDFFMTMNEKYLTCHEMTFLKWTCGPTFIDIRHKLLI